MGLKRQRYVKREFCLDCGWEMVVISALPVHGAEVLTGSASKIWWLKERMIFDKEFLVGIRTILQECILYILDIYILK